MADFPVTLSKTKITPLLHPERTGGFNYKATIDYTDVAVASATGSTDTVTITIGTTPARWAIPAAAVVVRTAFAGTTALTAKVGATDDDFAIAATSVLTAGLIQPSTGMNTVAAIAGSTQSSAQTLKVIFTNATGGSPSALTAGSADVYLRILDLDKIG